MKIYICILFAISLGISGLAVANSPECDFDAESYIASLDENKPIGKPLKDVLVPDCAREKKEVSFNRDTTYKVDGIRSYREKREMVTHPEWVKGIRYGEVYMIIVNTMTGKPFKNALLEIENGVVKKISYKK